MEGSLRGAADDVSEPEPEHLRCGCPHCGGAIEFPREAAGMGVECPHCGVPMNLVEEGAGGGELSGPEELPAVPGRPTVAELAGAFSGRVERPSPTASYRWALGVGLVVALAMPAVYAALVVLLGWGLFWGAGNWMAWAKTASGGALGAGLRTGLLVVGMGVGLWVLGSLLRPFVVKSLRRRSGLALSPVSEPLLFAFVHMVCDAVGVSRPARVEVDCRMNASVRFQGEGVGRGADDWVLTLGLPLVAGLSLPAFAGVLAHELGHFGQGWAMRACWVIRGLNEWLERAAGQSGVDGVLDRWSGDSPAAVHHGVLGLLRLGLGLSNLVVGSVVAVGRLVNRQLLRQMEWNADRVQIQMVGSDVFEATFRRLTVLAEVRRDAYRQLGLDHAQGRALPEDLPGALVRLADAVPEEKIERWCERRLARSEDFMDAHPSDASRLEQARSMAAPGVFRHGSEARALFSNFEILSRQATSLHYREDLRLPVE